MKGQAFRLDQRPALMGPCLLAIGLCLPVPLSAEVGQERRDRARPGPPWREVLVEGGQYNFHDTLGREIGTGFFHGIAAESLSTNLGRFPCRSLGGWKRRDLTENPDTLTVGIGDSVTVFDRNLAKLKSGILEGEVAGSLKLSGEEIPWAQIGALQAEELRRFRGKDVSVLIESTALLAAVGVSLEDGAQNAKARRSFWKILWCWFTFFMVCEEFE